ncbi:Hypothetical protein D9617_23g005910 [Elsinoe fawcettii]|nr:Hypothetical protein D9617_23g005910 [Elsinoe fawcettii]
MLDIYQKQHEVALAESGLIVTSPENILSFKLNGGQFLSDGNLAVSQRLQAIQELLDAKSRDVIDESDFTLSVKAQLIYPSGAQNAVDGNPWRWETAEKILGLVEGHLEQVRDKFPNAFLVVDRKPGFPIINFLREEPQQTLSQLLVEDIASGRSPVVRFNGHVSTDKAGIVKHVLTSEELDEKIFKKVVRMAADRLSAPKILLTARGLLLNLEQFKDSLQRVLRSDDPTAEFERWIGTTHLPPTLAQWNLINMEDIAQGEEMWKHLRLERSVTNHYLNHFVFPIHAKHFAMKLQASAWDVPLISKRSSSGTEVARTRGFSGTNDNKVVLPGTIKQDDLPGLLHTNAEVLGYLLESRNQSYQLAASYGVRLTENQFLKRLAGLKIRILIDAGAYVLEMDNQALAEAWLAADIETKAAVYFGRDHRIWVKYRAKVDPVPLVATHYAEDLSECVVYLDESHTRGVDLKFPPNARAALTLALGQTKDHTVQAAMRLRQLATTQSITFFAPPDVHQSLQDYCQPSGGNLNSGHVIAWLLEQTCKSNEDLLDLHFAQGIDFCRRKDAEWRYGRGNGSDEHRQSILNDLRRPESRTLAQLHGREAVNAEQNGGPAITAPVLQEHIETITRRRSLVPEKIMGQDALEEVEQEREIEFQVEEVREIQKSKPHQPFKFPGLHPALPNFAQTGKLDSEAGFDTVFAFLSATEAGQKYGIKHDAPSKLFVSPEFKRTVDGVKDKKPGDDYLRPVEWILWSPKYRTAIVIIPEEATLLLSTLNTAGNPKTHLLCYATPVTKSMRHFSKLTYFSIPSLPADHTPPSWLAIEVGILAGRMYFDGDELDGMREYLGLKDNAGYERGL